MLEVPIFVFLVTSLVLILTPGQDMILVMSRSVAQGPKAGVMTAAGISTGLLGHTLLAGLGLGAVLHTSQHLFFVLKIVGAVYLIYLGVNTFRASLISVDSMEQGTTSIRTLYLQGAVSNITNPKIAIFYFAFLPQFVSPGAEHPTYDLLILGALFALLTFIVKGPIGFAAGALSSWLRARPAIQSGLNRISGMVLVGLGVRLAFVSYPK